MPRRLAYVLVVLQVLILLLLEHHPIRHAYYVALVLIQVLLAPTAILNAYHVQKELIIRFKEVHRYQHA